MVRYGLLASGFITKEDVESYEARIPVLQKHNEEGACFCIFLFICIYIYVYAYVLYNLYIVRICNDIYNIYIWVNFITTSLFSLTGIMVNKGNYPNMVLFQVSELL